MYCVGGGIGVREGECGGGQGTMLGREMGLGRGSGVGSEGRRAGVRERLGLAGRRVPVEGGRVGCAGWSW